MNTPIYDFVKNYAERNALRLHMPGHKGKAIFGLEPYDITEIDGADVLYHSQGIIKESQENASKIFGSYKTVYSAEGSSLSIRAMLYLIKKYATENGKTPKILAGRNAHTTFVTAAALMKVEVEWIFSDEEGIASCKISPSRLEEEIKKSKPLAVYITSPDYLGNISNIKGLSEVCHKYGSLLLVDNAHGGYLKFLEKSEHPIDLGADICCDSAHKTMPCLTGSGYLHIGERAPQIIKDSAEEGMALFSSTSPSYLILSSLDKFNGMKDEFKCKLLAVIKKIEKLKKELSLFEFIGDECLKLTISAKKYGYTGYGIADYLNSKNIVCEFYDPDFVVMMFSAETTDNDIEMLKTALLCLEKRDEIKIYPPKILRPTSVVSMTDSIYMRAERILIDDAEGRILASAEVSCPPAIPVLMCGERIDREAIECFKYYGIKECSVLFDKN